MLSHSQEQKVIEAIQQETNLNATDARHTVGKIIKISNIIATFAPERTPYDYQANYLDDNDTRFTIYKKPRQIGASHMVSDKAVIKAVTLPNHSTIFCSMSLKDAKEKINYAEAAYNLLSERLSLPEVTARSRTEFAFANGSRILSLFSPRGSARADIVIDEFAFYQDPRRIWMEAMPIMIHQPSRMTVMSTPLHSFTMFNQIWEGTDGKFKKFDRREIRWWDCPTHCCNVKKARERIVDTNGDRLLDTRVAVDFYGTESLKELYDGMLEEDFQVEFELQEIDDDTALCPWDLIISVTPTGDDAVEAYSSLYELGERTRGNSIVAGYDVGRWKDTGELTVGVREGSVLRERYYETFNKVPFEFQEAKLDDLLSLPNVERLVIDAQGMGEHMAENLERKWGHRILKIKGGALMGSIATMTKIYMEKKRVEFIADKQRSAQMHSIKKSVTEKGNISYQVAKTMTDTGSRRKHHGDKFWSRGFMIWGDADMRSLGKPRLRFI